MELYNQAIERDIIAYLQDQTVPVSQAELEKALALGRDEAADRLMRMADEGLLMQTKRGKWALPQLLGCVCGRVQGTRKGFAFLLPDDGSEEVF